MSLSGLELRCDGELSFFALSHLSSTKRRRRHDVEETLGYYSISYDGI
ncbi:hypothetical protein ES708_13699 [subsurface metagenome]